MAWSVSLGDICEEMLIVSIDMFPIAAYSVRFQAEEAVYQATMVKLQDIRRLPKLFAQLLSIGDKTSYTSSECSWLAGPTLLGNPA